MSNQIFETPQDALEHFGKKGMRWGVINEQNKVSESLSKAKTAVSDKASTVSKEVSTFRTKHRELGVAHLKSRADVFDKKISELKVESDSYKGSKNVLKRVKVHSNNADTKAYLHARDRLLKDAEAKQNGKLTSTQKKVLIGAAFVGAVVVAGAIYAGHDSGATNSAILRGKAFLTGKESPFKLNASLSGKMSAQDILSNISKQINPNYSKAGGQMNCRRCTYAYELRRRGYDVAATTASHGTGQSESGVINALTPGTKNLISKLSVTDSIVINENKLSSALHVSGGAASDHRNNPIPKEIIKGLRVGRANTLEDFALGKGTSESSSLSVLKALEKQPNGARGEVLFNFGTFGHSMSYEVIGGKAHIFDNQKAKVYDSAKRVESHWDNFHSAEITRLDNANLDLSFLSRWATNATTPSVKSTAPAAMMSPENIAALAATSR